MITYQFRCLKCEREQKESRFEADYPSAEAARGSAPPQCPNGHGNRWTIRHYGASFYTGRKSNKGPISVPEERPKPAVPPPLPPDRYKDFNPETDTGGILSVGFRVEPEIKPAVDKYINDLKQIGNAQVIDPKRENYPEELFGLKQGSVNRKLFDVKQRKMNEELSQGAPVAGFFLPLEGEDLSSN